ncbi:MAG: TolC family protein [Bacteroidetes bacterium]|nr:TolC family protein [Bacteroidota bacterium]
MWTKTVYSGLWLVYFYAFVMCILFSGLSHDIKADDLNGGEKVFLTLEEAIATALLNNNQIKSSGYSLNKANWDVKNAWSQLIPTLSLNSRFTKIDEQTFAERDFRRYLPAEFADQIPQTVFQESYYTSFDVTLPVFNGAIITGIRIANSGEEMAEHMNNSTRQNIIFQVVNTYLNVLKAKEVVGIQKQYLELSQLNFEKAERMYEADRYSKSDVLRWKVDYQTQRGNLVNSESMLRSTTIALYRLLNMDMNKNVEIVGQLSDKLLDDSKKLSELSEQDILTMINLTEDELVQSNSALAAAKANATMSEKMHSGSYLNYLPNVSFSYSHAWRENGTLGLDDYSPKTAMLNFQMPIFSGFQNVTKSKSTYYDYKKSQEDFADQMNNTRYILTETVNKILNLKVQKELSKTNVEYTERNYRVVETQKEKGLVSNIDFVDAKLNLQNAQLTDVHNQYDFIIAMVELYYMLGKIDSLVE